MVHRAGGKSMHFRVCPALFSDPASGKYTWMLVAYTTLSQYIKPLALLTTVGPILLDTF